MKLASALSERSDIQRRLSQLTERLKNNAKVQEGESPSEDPQVLLKELNECLARLEDLMYRINLTNSSVSYEGETLTQLLARRDRLKLETSIMRTFLDQASSKVDRYSRAEIRIQSTVDVASLQKQVDSLSKELRQTDELIQQLNWTTELIEP